MDFLNIISRRMRRSWVGMVLACALVVALVCSAVADQSLFKQLEVTTLSCCSYFGSSFAAIGPGGDGIPSVCMVYVEETGNTYRFEAPYFSKIHFFDDGRSFLVPSYDDLEAGPLWTVYDMYGDKQASGGTYGIIRPSEGGKWFYCYNRTHDKGSPRVYDADLNEVKLFGIPSNVSRSWDATILGDTLYILRDNLTVKLFTLPDFELVAQHSVNFQPRTFRTLWRNESGSLLAISDYRNVGLFDLKTGWTGTIDLGEDRTGTVHISDDGRHIHLVQSHRDSGFVFREFIYDGGSITKGVTARIRLSELDPNLVTALEMEIHSNRGHLVVNFTSYSLDGKYGIHSLVLDLPLTESHSEKTQLLCGPTWVEDNELHTVAIDQSRHPILPVRVIAKGVEK